MTDSNNFNTDIILNEIDLVIKKGLNKILKDYMNRYNLLENTHKQIMQLPSVLNQLNKSSDNLSVDDSSDDDSDDDDYWGGRKRKQTRIKRKKRRRNRSRKRVIKK